MELTLNLCDDTICLYPNNINSFFYNRCKNPNSKPQNPGKKQGKMNN